MHTFTREFMGIPSRIVGARGIYVGEFMTDLPVMERPYELRTLYSCHSFAVLRDVMEQVVHEYAEEVAFQAACEENGWVH